MTQRWAFVGAIALVAACALSEAAAADTPPAAAVECRPPAYVQRAVGGAERVDLVRLGQPGECAVDPLEPRHDPDPACFAGYRRAGSFWLLPDGVGRVSRMLAGRNLACGATGTGTGPAFVVGFNISGGGGAVRATLRLPSGAVVFEIPNGLQFPAALSPSGLREWKRLVAELASQAGRSPAELERDLARDASQAPPARPAPAASAPDTSVNRQAASSLHPVVPDAPAQPVTKVSPKYPDIAREAGVDGTVTLSVLVGADGHVHDVRIVKSIPMLDAAAHEAALQWVFQPGTRAGKAVDSWLELPIKFALH